MKFLWILLCRLFSRTGCSHNGTMFANGSVVPSIEPCLNCKCLNMHLVCALRVCPEQPIPPPRGCVVVKKRGVCCPYLSCSKFSAELQDGNEKRKVVTHDRTWYEQNIRNRIFNQNALQRRIEEDDDVDEGASRLLLINNEKCKRKIDNRKIERKIFIFFLFFFIKCGYSLCVQHAFITEPFIGPARQCQHHRCALTVTVWMENRNALSQSVCSRQKTANRF